MENANNKNVLKGLIAYIYSNDTNCSNNGISNRVREVTIIGDDVDRAGGNVFPVKPERPAVRLVRRNIGGKPYVHAEPVDKPSNEAKCIGPMAGGCFIYSNDARFERIVGHSQPVSLHDRWETEEQYRVLSI